MNNTGSDTFTSDERVMAALAHFFGALAALIIWALQKDKSRFVRFQALQALAFDAIVTIINLIVMACLFGIMMIGVLGTGVVAAGTNSSHNNIFPLIAIPALLPYTMVICIMPISFIVLISHLIAAVSVVNGHNFHYPWIGTKVEAFLAT